VLGAQAAIAQAGATVVLHPGGSVHDEGAIEPAQHGIARVFASTQHFTELGRKLYSVSGPEI